MSEDVLKTYEFHVQIAEEDVRDGDATPWERVVAAFASTIRELQARVAELEKEHPVFVAAVAWATGREPFASATLEEAVDDYREETKL